MFDLDRWQEIAGVMRKNKLRTLLTASGVFWGMFMLVLMLGMGNGLEKGVSANMLGFATNAVHVWGRRTTMPYQGMRPGRRIGYDNDDTPALQAIPDVEYLAPRNQLGGYRGGANVIRGTKTGNFAVMGDAPDYAKIQPMNFQDGRFINPLDMEDHRKVAVLGGQVVAELFERGEDPIGEYVRINGVYFQVVGWFEPEQAGDDADRFSATIHVPFSTFQRVFNYGDRVGWFAMTGKAHVSGSELEEQVRQVLAARHSIHPGDAQAIGSFNAEEEFGKVTKLFAGIRFLVWFVGIATMLSGVVGVSNIMLIVVKERTREIGLRRAIGATPASVVLLIVQEAIVLTMLAGYSGLVAGVGFLELVGWLIGPNAGGTLGQPEIDVLAAVGAAFVLVIAGAFAGVIPARGASRIKPVDALRAE